LIKLVSVLLSNKNIKVINIHGASNGSFYRKFVIFTIGKYLFRKKIIYYIHGGGFKEFFEKSNSLSKVMIKTMLGNVDVVICLSQSLYKYYKNNFKIKKLIVVPNIIDYPEINRDTIKSTVLTFLFLGLICEEKGIFDLIKVIAKNKERYKTRIKLLIGGNGEVLRLKELISKNNIDDIVEFLGWISGKEKIKVLNECDVYILPSYNEALPISILESMSYGKAIISTNVGGIPEIVGHNRNGLLINPGDLLQMEQAIDCFLDNPELVNVFGVISEQIVKPHLPDSVIEELECIYKSILSNE
jgi:glycosyltransferase involved in cell wall biosynthesis